MPLFWPVCPDLPLSSRDHGRRRPAQNTKAASPADAPTVSTVSKIQPENPIALRHTGELRIAWDLCQLTAKLVWYASSGTDALFAAVDYPVCVGKSAMPHQIDRREILRIGGLSVLATESAAAAPTEPINETSCIFIMLQGGLSHLDTWDPKPAAVPEVRGGFRHQSTATPGIGFTELMAKSAALSEHLCVVRSMTHKFTNHIAGTYVTLTGSNNQQDRDREAHGDDFPGPGAVLNYLNRREQPGISVPQSISLPNWLSIPGPSNRMPGQYGGFLGSVHDPFLVAGDPAASNYRPLSLSLPDGVTA